MAGKENVIADALSRAPAATSEDATAMPINACLTAPQGALQHIVSEAQTCHSYKLIIEAFQQGKDVNNLPSDHPARKLKNVWHQISLSDEGIIMVDGDKIYLPKNARKETLKLLHMGHCGFEKTLKTARSLYYWPTMKYDVRSMVDSCESCQRLLPSKPLEPIITTTASFPMEKLSIDICHVENKNYMVTVDRYSGYFWVSRLRDLSTKAVTAEMDKITRVFGIPLSCRTDGGPQFRGPFDAYCVKQGIIHETSSPYNPRSNGHAEAAVKSAKHLLLKTSPGDFPEAIAAWRNTERDSKPSPNELFLGRKIRDTKPIALSQLSNKGHPASSAHAKQTQQIPPNKVDIFSQGERVRVQNQVSRRWDIKATVIGVSTSGRTLDLIGKDGQLFRRNRRFVRPSTESVE